MDEEKDLVVDGAEEVSTEGVVEGEEGAEEVTEVTE